MCYTINKQLKVHTFISLKYVLDMNAGEFYINVTSFYFARIKGYKMNIFTKRILEIISEREADINQLAKVLNRKVKTINKWLNNPGDIWGDDIYRLCVYLRVSADYLFGLSNKK